MESVPAVEAGTQNSGFCVISFFTTRT